MQSIQPNLPVSTPINAQPASLGSGTSEAAIGRLPTQTIAPSIPKPETYPDRHPQGGASARASATPAAAPSPGAASFTTALPLSPSPSAPGFSSLFVAHMLGQDSIEAQAPVLREVESAYAEKPAAKAEESTPGNSLRSAFSQMLQDQPGAQRSPMPEARPAAPLPAPAIISQAQNEAPQAQMVQAAATLTPQPAPKIARRDLGTWVAGNQAYSATNTRNRNLEQTDKSEEGSVDEAA